MVVVMLRPVEKENKLCYCQKSGDGVGWIEIEG